jgi:hypothetical protein
MQQFQKFLFVVHSKGLAVLFPGQYVVDSQFLDIPKELEELFRKYIAIGNVIMLHGEFGMKGGGSRERRRFCVMRGGIRR